MNTITCNEQILLKQLRENNLSAEMTAHLSECAECREQAESFKLVIRLHANTLAMPHTRLSPSAVLWKYQIGVLAKKRRRTARLSLFATTLSAIFAVMMIVFVLLGSQAGSSDGVAVHLPLIVAVCAILTILIASPMRRNTAAGR